MSRAKRIIFVTGTDTGVGKTVLTGLLLRHLRQNGCHALGIKPFCSGGLGDVEFLSAAQDAALPADTINPFYFAEPLAPLVAARRRGRRISLSDVLGRIHEVARRCECLLIEGAGGLLAPMGEVFCALDLITRLECEVIVVAANKLGAVNHTLLTIQALQHASLGSRRQRLQRLKAVLMNPRRQGACAHSNPSLLAELLAPVPLFCVPFLGINCSEVETLDRNAGRIKVTLASLAQAPGHASARR